MTLVVILTTGKIDRTDIFENLAYIICDANTNEIVYI